MKCRPVEQLVFEQIFSSKGLRASEPQNFHALLQRYLIVEVRQEVHAFYGHVDTQEAKYPGLDYTHPTHRIRLSRWPWHRRLFRAFDALALTDAEISSLTKWEGTKWAKDRFEREQGIAIRDTAADCMGEWVEPEDRPTYRSANRRLASQGAAEPALEEETASVADTTLDLPDESDQELESVGEALNERLRLRVALRNASGDTSLSLDEDWEAWLKNAIESGELSQVTAQIVRSADDRESLRADDIFPPRMLAAARAGQWHEIPDFLHDMIRHSLQQRATASGSPDSAQSNMIASSSTSSTRAPSEAPPNLGATYSSLASRVLPEPQSLASVDHVPAVGFRRVQAAGRDMENSMLADYQEQMSLLDQISRRRLDFARGASRTGQS